MVCGCSPSINFASCCGSALRSESSCPRSSPQLCDTWLQKIVGALFAKRFDQQFVGIFLSALRHDSLR